jgi:hypothetical protein
MYIKNNSIEIGSNVKTTKVVSSMSGKFLMGSEVKVVGIGERGYDLQDSEGNKIIECGFDCIELNE